MPFSSPEIDGFGALQIALKSPEGFKKHPKKGGTRDLLLPQGKMPFLVLKSTVLAVQNPCVNTENETDRIQNLDFRPEPSGTTRDSCPGGVPGGPRDICPRQPRDAPGRPGTTCPGGAPGQT